MQDTPVVFLAGARQTGKSTLANSLAENETKAQYITLDDYNMLSAAQNDPQGFLAGLPERVVIDEVQRTPKLILAIKADVDRNRKPGRFFLTGSANVLTIPNIADSLAGRMDIQILRPLSQGEIAGRKETFIDALFSDKLPKLTSKPINRNELQKTAIAGGYPEVRQRKTSQRRQAWYRNYITTIIHRDIRDISNINGLTQIPDILNILATRCANLLNYADLASSLQIPQTSLKRYMSLLESIFLIYRVKPWNVNLGSRLSKSPKVYLNDTGLISFLTGADEQRMNTDNILAGSIIENFVVNELFKQVAWSKTCPELFHFRTHSGYEVDVILENTQGKCVAIEVKSSATVSSHDVKNIRYLKNEIKDRFIRGVVLYTGVNIVPFDKNIHALPVNTLWS